MTTTYTSTLRLSKPEFRSPTWGPLMNTNMDSIDAAITNALAAANIIVWENATAYDVGTIAMDDTASPPTFWINTVDHTSIASPSTFADDRAAHSTYWSSLTFGITPRGEWDNDEDYGYYDIAYDSTLGIVGLCLVPHTSSSAPDTIEDDAANWVFIVDLPSVGVTPAANISFDNTTASLPGAPTNVQEAIDAVDDRIDDAAVIVADHETRLDAAEATIVTHTSSLSSNTSNIATHETRIDDAETDIATHESRLDALDALVAGLGSGFDAGTAMIFYQAAAPTGWTKETADNDKALRVTSGTGGSASGTSPFSTVFGLTATDATTITTSTMPAHTHSYNAAGVGAGGDLQSGATSTVNASGSTTGSNGSGGSHTHPIELRVQYMNVIVCTKD